MVVIQQSTAYTGLSLVCAVQRERTVNTMLFLETLSIPGFPEIVSLGHCSASLAVNLSFHSWH